MFLKAVKEVLSQKVMNLDEGEEVISLSVFYKTSKIVILSDL